MTDKEDGCDVVIDDALETGSYGLSVSKTDSKKDKRFALIIVDVQNDFMPPKGSLAVKGGLEIIPVINSLRENIKWDAIALTQDWHVPHHVSFHSNNPGSTLFQTHTLESGEEQMMWPDHCVQGSEGAKFSPGLVVKKTDIVSKKGLKHNVDSYSGFFCNDGKTKSDLSDKLKARGITDIVVTGVATDYCVNFTVLDGMKEGFRSHLVLDAVRGVAADSTKKALEGMKKAGANLIDSKEVWRVAHKKDAVTEEEHEELSGKARQGGLYNEQMQQQMDA